MSVGPGERAVALLACFLCTSGMVLAEGPRFAPEGQNQAVYREVVLDSDPRARTVAVAIRFGAGAAEDPRGEEGTAFLFGRLVERQGNQSLVQYGARMSVEVLSNEVLVWMVAAPLQWREAIAELEYQLYRAALRPDELETVRRELEGVLLFESGAPVRTFEQERDMFLLGPAHPGARAPEGTLSSVQAISLEALGTFREAHLRSENAVLAVTGPATAGDLGSLSANVTEVATTGNRGGTASGLPESAAPTPRTPGGTGRTVSDSIPPPPVVRLFRTEASPLEVPPEPLGAPAWTAGDRAVVDRQLTSTWVSVAFPFPRGTPPLLIDFLGHLIVEDLTPSPPDPGLFEAHSTRREIGGAPVLLVTASVDPRVTSRWEDRLTGAMRDLAEAPPAGAFFELTRRRFRSTVVIDLALPENRAKWLARRAAAGLDRALDLERSIWALQRPAVGAAAAAAGPSRTILMGPLEMMDL